MSMERLTVKWGEKPYPEYGKLWEYVERLAMIEDILGDTYDLDRLRDLVQADRDGRCVVFPCKVGDTVWNIRTVNDGKNTKEVYEAGEIKQMSVNTHGAFLSVGCYRTLDAERIGKTVFATREAAEQALKEVEKDG